MPMPCHTFLAMLPEYLDGELDNPARIRMEQHLAECPGCRKELDLQQEWLRHRRSIQELSENYPVPAGLNERIMAAVCADLAAKPAFRLPAISWRRTWPRLAGTAAVIVLLAISLQIFQTRGRTQATSTAALYNSSKEAAMADMSGKAAPNVSAGMAAGTTAAGSTTRSASANGWTVYSGNLAGLNAACSAPETQKEAAETRVLLPVLQESFSMARELRILTKAGPPARTLILTAWKTSEVDNQRELLKNAFATCENLVQIEIIKAGELPAKLNSLESNLYVKVFEQRPADYSWIFILIGE
jgi:hypothetical protein